MSRRALRRSSLPTRIPTWVTACAALLWLSAQVLLSQAFHLPGTQPNDTAEPHITDPFTAAAGGATGCSMCHQLSGEPARPFNAWMGSMMAHSARDPLFFAQLDLTNRDHLDRPAVAGMGDLCLRCHSPVGWLEGRSDNPMDPADHSGLMFTQKDVFGVQCHACHRLVDPFVPAGHVDIANILSTLGTMPGNALWPPTYGNGMLVMDPRHIRRGPWGLPQLLDHVGSVVEETAGVTWATASAHSHPVMNSAFQRSGNLCGSCHDVSNPTDCGAATNADTQQCFPIERTWTEWRHSSFFDATAPGGGEAKNCQSCHMSGPLNDVNFGVPCDLGGPAPARPHFNDIHYHDLTGGNLFVLQVLKDMKARFDACGAGCAGTELDFKNALRNLYPPVGAVGGPLSFVQNADLDAGIVRVQRTLKRSAFVEPVMVTPTTLRLRITNRTGHKLPTGYPEGRRMWLNLKFLSAAGALLAESGRYNGDDPGETMGAAADAALFHDQDLSATSGSLAYDVVHYTDAAGAELAIGRPTKVWEGRLAFDPGGTCDTDPTTCVEFHFALNNHIRMDNRIPPEGWNVAGYTTNRALPRIPTAYTANGWQGDYGASGGPAVHFDEVEYERPAGADRVEITLYYQTASREYIETLETDNPNTLNHAGYNRGEIMREEWERTGRSKPVVMRRLVLAFADADGDGLSDGWEATHGLPAGPDGGANGDPDGDGFSNWQEFQGGNIPVPPLGADSPTPGAMRSPVDIVLVLDKSGSMNDPAPGTTTPKMQVLRDSVTLFLNVWKDNAITGDRLGLVWFDTNADPAPVTLGDFATTLPGALTDVATRTASGWTAMGAGLHTALQGLAASTNPKHVILFSNGMQNRSPMIRENVSGSLVIRDQMVGDPDVTGGSNVTIGGSDFLIPGDVKIHTVGIGVAGTNSSGDGWHHLLHELAAEHDGEHDFITSAYQLEGVFLEDLVASLRGNTLEYVADGEWTLAPGETATFELPVNASARRFTAALSWAGQSAAPPRIELIRPDGQPEDPGPLVRVGSTFLVLTRYLSDADEAPYERGVWRLRLTAGAQPTTTGEPVLFRGYGLLDDDALEYVVQVPGDDARVGNPFRVTVGVTYGDRVLTRLDQVTVRLETPAASLGALLAASDARLDGSGSFDPDQVAGPYSRKLLAVLSDPATQRRLEPKAATFQLLDDGTAGDSQAGNGVYERDLLVPRIPGLYRVHVEIRGTTPQGQPFVRNETHSVVVGIGKLDLGRTLVRTERRGNDVFVLFTPRDRDGNLLGPGHKYQFVLQTGREPLQVEDLLDGTYRARLPTADAARDVRLVMDGQTFFAGDVAKAGRNRYGRWWWWWRWWWSALLVAGAVVFARQRARRR